MPVISGVSVKLARQISLYHEFTKRDSKMRSVNLRNTSWRKSSYSAANGDCVEVARLSNGYIAVRDSKNIVLPTLGFTPTRWQTFVGEVKHDRLDLP
jgi:hypothetical protein